MKKAKQKHATAQAVPQQKSQLEPAYVGWIPLKICGLTVEVNPHICNIQKIRVHDDVPMSPEYRAEVNSWLAKNFGYVACGVRIGNKLFVTQRVYDAIRESFRAGHIVHTNPPNASGEVRGNFLAHVTLDNVKL